MNRDDISALHSDVSPRFLPSQWQVTNFGDFVEWEDAPDPDGNWCGRCPICGAGAVLNFDRGVLRCDNDPSCHEPKRAMSLSNALNRSRDGK